MMFSRIALQLALATLGAANLLSAQGAREVIVLGRVVVGETPGTPVPGVDVFVSAVRLMVQTDSAGRFNLPGLQRGKSYEIIVTRIGLQQQLLDLDVGDTDSVTVLITMEQEPQDIGAVDVVVDRVDPRLSDYYANRRAGRGRAITREQIEKEWKGQRLIDVVRSFSSHTRLTSTGPRKLMLASRRGSILAPMGKSVGMSTARSVEPCFLRVFVDGMDQGTSNLMDFDLPTELVETVELFVGVADLPTRFNTMGNSCGVINILRRVTR